MLSSTRFYCLLFLQFFSFSVSAYTIHPLIRLMTGIDNVKVGNTQTLMIETFSSSDLPPVWNRYVGTSGFENRAFGGLFLGGELTSMHVDWQLGLGVYKTAVLQVKGIVQWFADPEFSNLGYQYSLTNQRLLLETRILGKLNKIQPYIEGGMGGGFTQAYNYKETPLVEDALPMSPPFKNHNQTSFSYFIGTGLDFIVNNHIRLGIGYRFVNLGSAMLGLSSSQNTTARLKQSLLTNEFLIALTYKIK